MIELINIKKSFDNKFAVDGISLKINSGEIVGFLGPNGAGKTTTMRIIAGFFVPDEGQVLIDSEDIQLDPIKAKSKIGYMPENNPLYKEMLVRDSLNFILELNNVPKEMRKEKLDKVIKSTNIGGVYFRPISELSKGYKQRVGLAQVLLEDPEILILDEPTEGLDPNQRNEIRELIKNLGKERTVIISTHVMQEVEAMCNRIIIINEGKIISDGSKDQILKGDENIIKLKVKSKKKLVQSDFSDIKSKNITINELKDGIFEVEINTVQNNIFEVITSKIKNNDWIILELMQKSQNLEDIFRQLTINN